ncbi:glycosyl hydrolase family 18 protein [Paenibacillus chartarius]|uniref:Glycosyl hydrolase family 18 protein n=1 Tax=Paenibacillus chartarius TaxID=747481 RepID=A0ABV6DLW0_9BACL
MDARNSAQTGGRGQRRRTGRFAGVMVLLSVVAASAITGYMLWNRYAPNTAHEEPDFGGFSKPILYQGKLWEESGKGSEASLKLPYSLISQVIDPAALYEEKSDSFIVTTGDKVLRMKSDALTAQLNDKPLTLKFPVEKAGKSVLVPIDPLRGLYPIELRESADTGAVILVKAGDTLQWAKPAQQAANDKKTAVMRTKPTVKAPIVADIKAEDALLIWGEAAEGEWYETQLPNGITGYMRKQDVVLDRVETIPTPAAATSAASVKPMSGLVNLTWEHVIDKNPDVRTIGPMPGVNVVSPTWFNLADGSGTVRNNADAGYVKWAQDRGYHVWALFSNGFDPKRTNEALATFDSRNKVIKQIVSFVQMYKLQGINIDFENVNLADKEEFTQFVRELTPMLHEQGAVVSVDVTPKSTNENWSMFYDRKALAQTVDYMMVMTYDEHWATSPKSGPVSSLPWMENSITRILREDQVPSSKLVLGIPYYTRIWAEETKDGKSLGKSDGKPRSVGMNTIKQLLTDKKLTPVFQAEIGQNYVEFMEDNKLKRIWLEDEVSIKARLELVKKYNLGGVATWRRGMELPETWKWIEDGLK